MERLTPLADAFLEAEDVDPLTSLAIGSLAVFEGPTPEYAEFVGTIAGRLPLIPRYRQRLHPVLRGLAAPAWVDQPDFDLDRHLHHVTVPAPGGRVEVGDLMSELMSTRMDRDRPLWDYWFVDGLTDGRWGVLSKLHHSMVDGVSGTDLYRLVLDPTPVPRDAVADTWQPDPPDSPLGMATDTARGLVAWPGAVAGRGLDALRSPRRLVRATAESISGLVALAGALRPVPSTSLTGTLDGHRRYAWTVGSLDDIRTVRETAGVTVNDVALAAVAGGFRRLLLARGEVPGPHALRSLVPVSTRAPGDESVLDNRVSLMLPYLPVDLADPAERLAAVHERIRSLRDRHEPEAGGSLTEAAGWLPFTPVRWGVRLGMALPQRQVTTVTTNVPGPRETLYCLGREALELLPYVPIADRVRIGIAILSYRDALAFGITGDRNAAPDLEVLADGIAESLAEIVALAR